MRNVAKPFWMSLSSIFLSELGDKTFFISAILSMSNSPWIVFCGSMFALTTMTLFACLIGYIIPNLFTPKYTHYASCVLFLIFGVKGLYEGIFFMKSGDANSEFLEVKAELDKSRKKEGSISAESKVDMVDVGSTLIKDVELCKTSNCNSSHVSGEKSNMKNFCVGRGGIVKYFKNKTFIQSFTLTALAEWGDRSQITTILLSSYYYPPPVFFGSIIGHFVCTGLACYAGKYLSKFISPRMVTLSGGVLFLAFALFGLVFGPE